MKKSISQIAVISIFSTALLFSCNTSTTAEKVEDAKEEVIEANKDLNEANLDYLTDIENYRLETADKVTANEAIVKDFNARIELKKDKASLEYAKKIEALENKNTDLKKKLDDYKQDGKENWDKFKIEFNHDMEELGNAFKDLGVKNVK